MTKRDLFSLYSTRLQQYEKDFNKVAISPFHSIKIYTNPEGSEWERLGIVKDLEIYHLHQQMEEFFPDLIDFAVLLSFIPQDKRDNWDLLKLLFVIKFGKSKHSQLTEIVDKFVSKFIQEGSFNPNVDRKLY